MKRYTPIIDGSEKEFKPILEVTDDGELLKRSEVLQKLLEEFWKNEEYEGPQAPNAIYFAIRALGFTKQEVFLNHSIRLPDNWEKSNG